MTSERKVSNGESASGIVFPNIDVWATVNALLGDTFSRENNTHGSRFHDRDPQFASRISGALTQSCYIGTRDIRSRVIRGPYCISYKIAHRSMPQDLTDD